MKKTLNLKQLKRQRKTEESIPYTENIQRPRTRGDCIDGARPCPWVSCKYHLYLDVSTAGSISINSPVPLEEMAETCALDMAKRVQSFSEIGRVLGMSKQAVERIQFYALQKLSHQVKRKDYD